MFGVLSAAAVRLRLLTTRLLARLGLREESFLLVLAVIIGVVTAAAAVAFHELINQIRILLYENLGPRLDLYGRGIALLILLPAAGGLVVGIVGNYLTRSRQGHGIIDVLESVIRSSGFIKPGVAVEKIFTSAVTIGSGGSAGAEGPIVQIGAAIASGVGQIFRIARQHMPLLIGCGSAAGISAIFNSPIGGVLFTLEVILYDFSFRTFTPVVLASVVANVTTQAIFRTMGHLSYDAIFAIPLDFVKSHVDVGWSQVPAFAILGVACGLVGVSLTRLMHLAERTASRVAIPATIRPAVGGALMGVMGVAYVMVFGWWLLGKEKPFEFSQYPLPAFFGDGYGVIRQMLETDFYARTSYVLPLLAFLVVAKLLATCLTLGSGGSGGIIAPAVFLGAACGGSVGLLLEKTGSAGGVQPNVLALVGMGAVLAAVVHAPLASILILLDLTRDPRIVLPAMLATIIATGVARVIFQDSIYSAGLRLRGVRVGAAADLSLLRRMSVEQVHLDPAIVVRESDTLRHLLNYMNDLGASDFVVCSAHGGYVGMVTGEDLKTALLQPEVIPLLTVQDVVRVNIPTARTTDDLAGTLDLFAQYEVSCLPVALPANPERVIGLISRSALMSKYQEALASA